MTRRLIYFIFLLLALTRNLWALSSGFDGKQVTFSTGTISTSFTERTTEIENTEEPAAGSASALPLDFSYEFFVDEKYSWFVRGIGPLVSSGDDNYFFGGGGINFYIMSLSSVGIFKGSEISLKVVPKWRYYWGLNGGIGNLTYTNEAKTKKKSDQILEVGLHAGAIYSINSQWGVKAEASFNRGIGTLTEVSTIKVLIGASYYL